MVIGICGSDNTSRNMLYKYVVRFSEEYNRECTIYTYSSANSLVTDNMEFDVLLLDTEMQGMDNAEFISWINAHGHNVLFIFVTACVNYKPEGFTVSAFRYLIQPVGYGQLATELIAAEKALTDKNKIKILLKDNGRNLYVMAEDIYYIESEHNNLSFAIDNRRITNKGTIKNIIESLNSQFCQIHRSYIVNFAHIKGRDKNDLIMPDGNKIPVSKYRLKQFEEQYKKYWNGLL